MGFDIIPSAWVTLPPQAPTVESERSTQQSYAQSRIGRGESNVQDYREIGIQNTEWLELLLSFAAVKNLYLSKQFAPRITSALQEPIGGRTTEGWPALQKSFLEGVRAIGTCPGRHWQFILLDGSPINPSTFLSGTESRSRSDHRIHRRSTIGSCTQRKLPTLRSGLGLSRQMRPWRISCSGISDYVSSSWNSTDTSDCTRT